SGDHAHDVGLLHDQEVLAVELSGPFAEQDPSPVLTSGLMILPASSRPPGPTAMTSPCDGFSLAVSGMMIPPFDFSSASIRFTATRVCRGRNLVLAMRAPHQALARL